MLVINTEGREFFFSFVNHVKLYRIDSVKSTMRFEVLTAASMKIAVF
jgi:hypothetical protein